MRNKNNVDVREACVSESLKIIEEHGIKGLSIREVARRLKISHGAPYRHYENRDALIAEIAIRGYELLASYLVKNIDYEKKTLPENYINLLDNYMKFSNQHGTYYDIIFLSDLPPSQDYPALKKAGLMTYFIFEDLVVKMKERGEWQVDDVKEVCLELLSKMQGLATLVSSKKIYTAGYTRNDVKKYSRNIFQRFYDSMKKQP